MISLKLSNQNAIRLNVLSNESTWAPIALLSNIAFTSQLCLIYLATFYIFTNNFKLLIKLYF